MRKFENLHRVLCLFAPRAVRLFQLPSHRGDAIPQFSALAGERVGVDFLHQPQVQQFVLLLTEQRHLPLQFLGLLLAHPPLVFRAGAQHFTEPISGFVVLLHRGKRHQDLFVELAFGYAVARMSVGDAGDRAAIVNVALPGRLLGDLLAGDEVAAMAAADQTTGIGQVGMFIGLAAEQVLNAIPRLPIHQRLVPAGMPLAFVLDFADVGPIAEHVVDARAREGGSRVAENASLGTERVTKGVNRVRAGGEQVEESPHIVGVGGFQFDRAASSDSNVAIAIRPAVGEPAFLDAAFMTFTHVDALLIGVERRHARQRPPHHAAGGIGFHGLTDADERHTVIVFEPFEFHIIEEVSRSPVNFVEQHPVDFARVLLRVSQQFPERRPLGRFGRRLRHAEQLDDRAAGLGRVLAERFFLHGKAEPFSLLFTARYPGEGDELLAHERLRGC